jgi:hypothetical protein
MLSREKLRESIPEGGIYKGSAEISFCAPEGTVWGQATISVSSTGYVSVKVDIERYSIPDQYRDLLMPFLEGVAPERSATGTTTFRLGGREKEMVGRLKVETPEGHFRASCVLVGQCHFALLGEGNPWCEVIPHDLEFSTGNSGPEEIWCMPLFGDLSKFYGCANTCFIDGPMPYIHFSADGHDCGVQIFRVDGTPDAECTAVAFGVVGNRADESAEEVNRLIPWGLFAALGFASGRDVRAPWIELRGEDGNLRRRIHQRFGGSEDDGGFATFSIADSAVGGSGIAEFLRLFFELPQGQRRSITTTMNLVRRGAPGNATVDESITT